MIRLAIIGTGGMGNEHARQYADIPGCKVVAACDAIEPRVKEFASKYDIPETFTDVDSLLKFGAFDAVSNVTPDTFHAPISEKVIRAGKHILCEKPLAVNYPDAVRMRDAAHKAKLINMVNFSYRGSSALETARDLVEAGKIGRVIHFEAHYLQSWLSSKIWGDWRSSDTWLWRLSTDHGSQGTLGDIGVHTFEMATLPTGPVQSVHCRLKTFDKAPGNKVGKYDLDANDSAIITVESENGGFGTVHLTRWATGYANRLAMTLHGDEGALRIVLSDGVDDLDVCLGEDVDTCTWKKYDCDPVPNVYNRFIRSIQTQVNAQPDFARGAEVQQILDACFLSAAENRTVEVSEIKA